MAFSARQCRAARGLLNWSQGELGQRARVDQRTITNFERGASTPHPRTLEAMAKEFETAGIVFLEPAGGLCDGVALKVGVELPERERGEEGKSATGEGRQSASQGSAWDDGIDAIHEEAPPAVDPEIEELRTYWRANPDKWAAMHKSTRWALLDEMGLRQL
jgi:transcriptional regulator with XRE-family HTH domain